MWPTQKSDVLGMLLRNVLKMLDIYRLQRLSTPGGTKWKLSNYTSARKVFHQKAFVKLFPGFHNA